MSWFPNIPGEKSEWSLVTAQHVLTPNLGVHNNLFGGQTAAWFDEASVLLAERISRNKHFLTKSLCVDFLRPAKVADTIYFYGKIMSLTKSGVGIKLLAVKVDHVLDAEYLVAVSDVVLVAVADGQKTKLVLHSDYLDLESVREGADQ